MLGKLKNATEKLGGDSAIKKVTDKLCPELSQQLEKVQNLDGTAVQCDQTFTEKFISPTLVTLAAASSGVTKLIPGFENRFTTALLHTRDELISVCGDTGQVSLTTDFQQRLPNVLLEGFKKSA